MRNVETAMVIKLRMFCQIKAFMCRPLPSYSLNLMVLNQATVYRELLMETTWTM